MDIERQRRQSERKRRQRYYVLLFVILLAPCPLLFQIINIQKRNNVVVAVVVPPKTTTPAAKTTSSAEDLSSVTKQQKQKKKNVSLVVDDYNNRDGTFDSATFDNNDQSSQKPWRHHQNLQQQQELHHHEMNRSSNQVQRQHTIITSSLSNSSSSSLLPLLSNSSTLRSSQQLQPTLHPPLKQKQGRNAANQEVDNIDTTSNSDSTFTVINNDFDDFGFGAAAGCLIVMDDNYILAEWLAYHYQKLPLRRLIVAIDPKSKTTPIPILKRFDSLINITVWKNDLDYDYNATYFYEQYESGKLQLPPKLSNLKRRAKQDWIFVAVFLMRQKQFIYKCLETLHYEEHRQYSWTAVWDTDEFIVPNRFYYYTANYKNNPNKTFDESSTRNSTIVELIQRNNNSNSESPPFMPMDKQWTYPCISMNRQNVGMSKIQLHRRKQQQQNNLTRTATTTSKSDNNNSNNNSNSSIPQRQGWDPNELLYTYKYRTLLKTKLPGKGLVDVSRIDPSVDLRDGLDSVGCHRPVRTLCSEKKMSITSKQALFTIYQYIGNYETWSFRQDYRQKRTFSEYLKQMGWKESDFYDDNNDDNDVVGKQQNAESNIDNDNDHIDDDNGSTAATYWLDGFIQQFGLPVVQELLKDNGNLFPEGNIQQQQQQQQQQW